MSIIEQKQIHKTKAIKYLVSKGYTLSLKLAEKDQAPRDLVNDIYTKKICIFELKDPKNKLTIDQVYTEYGAIPSDFESGLRSLLLGTAT